MPKQAGTDHSASGIGEAFSRFRQWFVARQSRSQGGPHTAPFAATRTRLVLVNLAVVSTILALMAVAIYGAETHAIDQQVNEQLRSYAAQVPSPDVVFAPSLSTTPSTKSALPNESERAKPATDNEFKEHYAPSSPNVFAIVLGQNGQVLSDPSSVTQYGLPDKLAARPVLTKQASSTLVTARSDGKEFRLYTVPVSQGNVVVGALQTGMSLEASERELHDLLVAIGLIGLGVLGLTTLASLFLADRALVPVRLAFEQQRQFAAAASHELRTPLAIIRSQAELVMRELGPRSGRAGNSDSAPEVDLAEASSDVAEIMTEVDYMTRLVRDLLLLARAEGDQRGLMWETVDIASIARDVITKVQPTAAEHQVTVDYQAPPDHSPLWANGDSDRLRQLVLILVENAIHYTAAGGHVWVSTSRQSRQLLSKGHDGTIQLTVRDTGVGIDAAHLPHIFEPFYRGGSNTSKDDAAKGNAGLGLALARWIARAHGGEIDVVSRPGEGSAFAVSLPAADPDEDTA